MLTPFFIQHKVQIATKSDVLRDEQGLFKQKEDDYTNTVKKDRVLKEYSKQSQPKGQVQYNKVQFLGSVEDHVSTYISKHFLVWSP